MTFGTNKLLPLGEIPTRGIPGRFKGNHSKKHRLGFLKALARQIAGIDAEPYNNNRLARLRPLPKKRDLRQPQNESADSLCRIRGCGKLCRSGCPNHSGIVSIPPSGM